jgi:hypothetical protein
MSRRILRILSSLGLSIFLSFMFVSTSIPVSAHATTNRTPSSVTPRSLNTNVICYPKIGGPGWTQTGNGPASFGCGGHAWQIQTPTINQGPNVNYASWELGTVDFNENATFSIRAFITQPANAVVDYKILNGGLLLLQKCTINQNIAVPGWNNVCSFHISWQDVGVDLSVLESSGQAHNGIMSASAIQLIQTASG